MAKILAVEPMCSKSGRDMLKLTVEVDTCGPKCLEVTDYLILHSDFAWKIEQYLAAIGRQFGAGENVTIDQRTFLGGKFVALTYNEPGQKNPGRLYLKIHAAMRPQDASHMGALTPDELEYYGLNHDGTRPQAEQRAVAQQQQPQNSMWQNSNSMGRQTREQYPAHPGHQPPQRATVPGLPPVEDNMEDDDIPF